MGLTGLHVSILAGMVGLIGLLYRISTESISLYLVVAGIFGVLLCISWVTVILSYSQLNREKFRVLHDLEDKLPFQFFKNEWDPGNTGAKSNRYRQLTKVETLMPIAFVVFFILAALYGAIDIVCGITSPPTIM